MDDDEVPNQHEAGGIDVTFDGFLRVSLDDQLALLWEMKLLRDQVAALQKAQTRQLKVARAMAFRTAADLVRDEAVVTASDGDAGVDPVQSFLASALDDLAEEALK